MLPSEPLVPLGRITFLHQNTGPVQVFTDDLPGHTEAWDQDLSTTYYGKVKPCMKYLG